MVFRVRQCRWVGLFANAAACTEHPLAKKSCCRGFGVVGNETRTESEGVPFTPIQFTPNSMSKAASAVLVACVAVAAAINAKLNVSVLKAIGMHF